jgi:hypothetical protein
MRAVLSNTHSGPDHRGHARAGQRFPGAAEAARRAACPATGQGRPRTTSQALRADKAYSARAHRRLLRARGITAVVPNRVTRSDIARTRGPAADDRSTSTPTTTRTATPSIAPSTTSRTGAGSQPATTNTRSPIAEASSSPQDHERRSPDRNRTGTARGASTSCSSVDRRAPCGRARSMSRCCAQARMSTGLIRPTSG